MTLMTVHCAKGLEFPVVAVADLGRAPMGGGGVCEDARWQLELAAAEVLAKLGRPRADLMSALIDARDEQGEAHEVQDQPGQRDDSAAGEPPLYFRRQFYVSQATMAWLCCS